MRTVEVKLYKLSELSEQAKQNAIDNLSDINVNYEWWEFIYEDAENVGLKITGFDIDRASYVRAEFVEYAQDTALKILDNHGETCDTYTTAETFLSEYNKLVATYSDGKDTNKVAEDKEDDFDIEVNDLEKEFLDSLCEDYLSILRKEYEHHTSEEAIIETIEANEYEFTEDGELY